MSLIDRTEDVEFVDIPTEFKMSAEWANQWSLFLGMVETLTRNSIPVSDLSANGLDLTDEEQESLIESINTYDGITRENYRGLREWGTPYMLLRRVRKSFLSFNRKANYEWCFSRAKGVIIDYQNVRQELIGYEEHLDLPEIDVPNYESSFVTPFVQEAHLVVSEWLAERYDHERKITRMLPTPVLELPGSGPTPRAILAPVGESQALVRIKLELYNIKPLLHALCDIKEKYDIETQFQRAQAAVAGLQNMFGRED